LEAVIEVFVDPLEELYAAVILKFTRFTFGISPPPTGAEAI
jgi:hypothetical protein